MREKWRVLRVWRQHVTFHCIIFFWKSLELYIVKKNLHQNKRYWHILFCVREDALSRREVQFFLKKSCSSGDHSAKYFMTQWPFLKKFHGPSSQFYFLVWWLIVVLFQGIIHSNIQQTKTVNFIITFKQWYSHEGSPFTIQ